MKRKTNHFQFHFPFYSISNFVRLAFLFLENETLEKKMKQNLEYILRIKYENHFKFSGSCQSR